MAEIEKIELARYQREILEDLRHLPKRYCRIMEWDVPEVGEKAARTLIFKALRAALADWGWDGTMCDG